MKQLKKDLSQVSRTLKELSQKTAKIAKELEKLGKVQASKKPRVKRTIKAKSAKPAKEKAARKQVRASAVDNVLGAIQGSPKGIDLATLKKKTGLEGRKANDIIYRLTKQGKIKSGQRGIYVMA
ncbi:MAG: hypothetical protein V1689_11800 [Pseudomonadota bacterium]